MSELTDLMITALGGNPALVLVLVGLFLLNGWQTRHMDKRLEAVGTRVGRIEDRVKRTESHLIDKTAYTDGGKIDTEGED